MTEITNLYGIKLGAEQSYKNLTLFPILASYSSSRNFLTTIEPFSVGNTEQNRSTYEIIRNYGNDRITASRDYIEQFARVDGQIGAVFLINGKLAGLFCLHGPEAFKNSFIKIVECYASKADEAYNRKIDRESSKSGMLNFLKTAVDSGIGRQPAAGI